MNFVSIAAITLASQYRRLFGFGGSCNSSGPFNRARGDFNFVGEFNGLFKDDVFIRLSTDPASLCTTHSYHTSIRGKFAPASAR